MKWTVARTCRRGGHAAAAVLGSLELWVGVAWEAFVARVDIAESPAGSVVDLPTTMRNGGPHNV